MADTTTEILGRSSYSGSDIRAWAYLAGYHLDTSSSVVELDVQTISLSSFREKVPVRGLGMVNAIGHTAGPRTYAGSMIFTIIDQHPLYKLIESGFNASPKHDYSFSYDERMRRLTRDRRFNPDGLPPMNIILTFANELGNRASIVIFGVEIVNNGITMSIEDPLTENTYQYVARDAIVLVRVDKEGKMVNIVGDVDQMLVDVDLEDPQAIQETIEGVELMYGGYQPSTPSATITKSATLMNKVIY